MVRTPIPENPFRNLPNPQYKTILADPPWQFSNRTGKMAPEHRRLSRYGTMTLEGIRDLPVETIAAPESHLYLWVPNALITEGLEVMWDFIFAMSRNWCCSARGAGSEQRLPGEGK